MSESVADYVVALRKLSVHCNFGGQWDQRMRNRLVSGLRDGKMRNRLLSEGAKLTWDRAVELSVAADVQNNYAVRGASNENGLVQKVEPHAPSWSKGSQSQSTSRYNGNRQRGRCHRCFGTNHQPQNCRFKEAICHSCKGRGHIKKACQSRQVHGVDLHQEGDHAEMYSYQQQPRGHDVVQASQPRQSIQEHQQPTHQANTDSYYTQTAYSNGHNDCLSVRCVSGPNNRQIVTEIDIEGVPMNMEVDTGSCITLITHTDYAKHFSHLPLQSCDLTFRSASGGNVHILGKFAVTVRYGEQEHRLCLRVARGQARLLGRDWLSVIRLKWAEIGSQLRNNAVHGVTFDRARAIEGLKQKHAEVFKKELGTLKGIQAKLTLKEGVTPKTTKPYRVPLAMRDKVEGEYDKLEVLGILEKVSASEWSTGVVAVPKPGGAVRICGNYKTTLNPALMPVAPPQINVDSILASINVDGKSKYFTTLDLAQAYNQMVVDKESRPLLALATHKGLYAYTRLAFGVSVAPALWQNAMEQVLMGLDRVQVYYDDILIGGRSEEEHVRILDQVMTRLEEYGLRLNGEKCMFFRDSVEYLGMVIDANGIAPIPSKMEGVLKTPKPQDATQLRSYLSMLSYYRRYLKNLASEIAPLTDMLSGVGKQTQLRWNAEADLAFEKSKSMLRNSGMLIHFDHTLKTRVTCDASRDGIAAILSHIGPDGEDRPVQFCSRALTATERLYPQLEREALAIVYGLNRFYYFLYGRRFTLVTDNQPLTWIFSPSKGLPVMTAEKIQRWALYVSQFQYDIEFKRGSENNADFLSRVPVDPAPEDVSEAEVGYVFSVTAEVLPITANVIAQKTAKDPTMMQVMKYTHLGWPAQLPPGEEQLQPYFARRDEIGMEKGCILMGLRVVIPPELRQQLLDEVHVGHPGIVKSKAIARSYIWWPGLDKDLERRCNECEPCQLNKSNPPTVTTHPWIPAKEPWERIHVDYAGPFEGHMFLVVVDAFAKWPEILMTTNSTSTTTCNVLRGLFARYGLPQVLVSDNGPCFTSAEFHEFTERYGIQHKCAPPYHPATNGQAERFVRSFKEGMKKDTGNMQVRLDKWLLAYRNAPHTTTGVSPANKFLGRSLRTRLDLLLPTQMSDKSMSAELKVRQFEVGDAVWVRDYMSREIWKKGKVTEITGPLTYMVQVQGKGEWRRHVDQMRFRVGEEQEVGENCEKLGENCNAALMSEHNSNITGPKVTAGTVTTFGSMCDSGGFPSEPVSRHAPAGEQQLCSPDRGASSDNVERQGVVHTPMPPEVPLLRRSGRVRKPPERLNL